MIMDIFKTPLDVSKLEMDPSNLIDYIYKVKDKSKGDQHSNQGGWQSHNLSHFDEPFIKAVLKNVNLFATKIELKTPLILEKVWSNINKYKDFNMPHIHPGAVISGVFYLKIPQDSGNIVFYHPLGPCFSYDWQDRRIAHFNSYNSYTWTIPSEELSLYLFPSWLEHYVEPSQNKQEDRISISFNFNYKT